MSSLSEDVAQRIVDRTSAVIGHNVNVMDARGTILASGHPSRRGEQHEGALLAAQGDRAVVIDADQARGLRGAHPGVNLPLRHHGEVVGVVGISGDPATVQPLADLIRVTAELIVEQAGALESGQRLQQEREDHLCAVVEGRVDPLHATRRAEELGITDLLRCCTVVRAEGTAGAEALRTLQRQLVRRPDLLVARTRSDELAVWWPTRVPDADADVHRAVDAHPGRLVAASGRGFEGPHGLRRAWVAAQDALAVSGLEADLYDPRDLPLVALLRGLADDWRADALSEPWRALVAADRHGELRTTLRAWFQHDLSPHRCAEALHVHRNTLRGRLDRIQVVTGLDLRRVPSLVQLYLGPILAQEASSGRPLEGAAAPTVAAAD